MKLPREIDELMWDVAERDDSETLDQFVERYPEFRSELAKRLQMVRGLRGSRPTRPMPAFELKHSVRNLGPSRLTVAGVAVLVIGSVAFATYATVQFLGSRSEPTVTESLQDTAASIPPLKTPNTGSGQDAQVFPKSNTLPSLPDPYFGPARTVFDSPVTIESDDMSLEEAIREIVEKAGLEVTIPPGFPDKRIRLSYIEQPAISILHDLGRAFGFTPFRQEEMHVLVVPARDRASQPNTVIPGSARGPAVAESVDDTADRGSDSDDDEQASQEQDFLQQ